MKHDTVFSPCRKYRYTLWREWSDLLPAKQPGFVQFIGLNPSTADEVNNDPTVRRCIQFCKDWGYGAYCMTNIFALRSTDPRALYVPGANPIGPENLEWLVRIAREAALVICAWGNHGERLNQGEVVRAAISGKGIPLHCLGKTSTGQPKHPLYLPKNLRPFLL